MANLYHVLHHVGGIAANNIWFPLLIWSGVSAIVFMGLRIAKGLSPLYHYHLRVATLAAIPIGLLLYLALPHIEERWLLESNFDPAVFVVVSDVIATDTYEYTETELIPTLLNLHFIVGLVTVFLFGVSSIFLARLALGILDLFKLRTSLQTIPLSNIPHFEHLTPISVLVSFHPHAQVPFTFGWRHPVIVLPQSFQNNQKKIRMAVYHELVHIGRSDYLIQLLLSVVQTLFWFHPLIRLVTREIELWREISCDQEVLNRPGISLKQYASLLYELQPLHKEFGYYSIPMAVQSSTLKKRIETMKHHNRYQCSIKRSLFYLFAMIVGITLPMACSELQSPDGLSEKELTNTNIMLDNPTLYLNGDEIASIEISTEVSLAGGIALSTKEYGTITFSGTQFKGAKKLAVVEGNTISVQTNGLHFELINKSDFLKSSRTEIWALHQPNRTSDDLIVGLYSSSEMRDYNSLSSLAPKINTTPASSNNEFLTVVEEMPELIGVLASIQSKVVYPEIAKRAGIEGRVIVQLIVNEKGEVEDPKITRGIGGGCDEAALAAVREAKFTPGKQNGKAVRTQISIPIVFRLNDSDFAE